MQRDGSSKQCGIFLSKITLSQTHYFGVLHYIIAKKYNSDLTWLRTGKLKIVQKI